MATVQAMTAYETKSTTIADTAVPISAVGWSWTAGNVAKADAALICCYTQPVVVTYDGTTPTATLGVYLAANAQLRITGNANVGNIQLIRAGGSSGTVSITLEKF